MSLQTLSEFSGLETKTGKIIPLSRLAHPAAGGNNPALMWRLPDNPRRIPGQPYIQRQEIWPRDIPVSLCHGMKRDLATVCDSSNLAISL